MLPVQSALGGVTYINPQHTHLSALLVKWESWDLTGLVGSMPGPGVVCTAQPQLQQVSIALRRMSGHQEAPAVGWLGSTLKSCQALSCLERRCSSLVLVNALADDEAFPDCCPASSSAAI